MTEIDEKVSAALSTISQRYTSGRKLLVDVLAKAGSPLSTGDIARADRNLPQSSIYRNLTVLEEAGVVNRVAGGGEFERFELADSLSEHHHHLICESCGRIEDVDLPDELEQQLHRVEPRVGKRRGFDVTRHRVDFFGRCPKCQKVELDVPPKSYFE